MHKPSFTTTSSLVVFGAAMIVLLYSGEGEGKTPKHSNRSTHGCIQKVDENQLVLDVKNKKPMVFSRSGKTLVYQDVTAKLEECSVGRVVRIQGVGKLSSLEAQQVILLPAAEKFIASQAPQSGPAYGEKMKKVNIKAKVVQTDPLTVINRGQQALQLTLAEQGEIFKRTVISWSELQEGMRILIEYKTQPNGQLHARRVVIQIPGKQMGKVKP